MQFTVIQRVMGLLLILFSFAMLPCLLAGYLSSDGTLRAFALAYAITIVSGILLWAPVRHANKELRLRDGFIIVSLFWALLAFFGALPFMFAGTTAHMADAYFETMSGLTTTGSTILTGLDILAPSMNLWRGILQFLGGMGIVVLAVAILPMLGVGGMQLFKAETPGPMKDSKLTPRIKETAKALWYIYLGLTIACAMSLWLAGMTPFDAIFHSFTTVATGGFSTHDASIAYFNSAEIEMIMALFMFLGGANFALHFLALRERNPSIYGHDTEFLTYLGILLAAILFVALYLTGSHTYPSFLESLRYAVFQVVTMATTSGFMSADFGAWPPVLGALLMIISFFSGSAGSTSGAIKVVRITILFKQTLCEIRHLIHPSAMVPLKLSGKVVPENAIAGVSAFFATYVASFTLIGLSITALDVDLVTAFSATAAALNNTGPGLGAVGPALNFAGLPMAAKWILSFAMLLGRLELFTLFVILTPIFWRK
ncbi:MAG TPA: TrkH family potassium uptake protein [Gammaproteobacteria bacterium]|nr:TrkH family potassium uptake protein [Gammaproteobacteria bacterium]